MERDQATKFINDLLKLMVSRNGSDLFITAEFPPAIKIDGRITKVSPQPLSPVHTLTLALHDKATGAVLGVESLRVGVRTVLVEGKRLRVNGAAVCIAGVNRHEHDERRGKAVTIDTLKKPYWQSHYVVAKRVLPKEHAPLRVVQR